jgi:hypothetical protein
LALCASWLPSRRSLVQRIWRARRRQACVDFNAVSSPSLTCAAGRSGVAGHFAPLRNERQVLGSRSRHRRGDPVSVGDSGEDLDNTLAPLADGCSSSPSSCSASRHASRCIRGLRLSSSSRCVP